MSVGDAKIAILDFLRDSPGRPAATIGELLDKLNIELGPEDIGRLVQELRRNDRVLHDSADGTYRYRPQVEGVLSRADLLEFLTKVRELHPSGQAPSTRRKGGRRRRRWGRRRER